MRKTNDDNQVNHDPMSRFNLVCTSKSLSEEELIRLAIIEGNRMLAEEEKNGKPKSSPIIKKTKPVAAGKTNPEIFIKAKAQVLERWKKNVGHAWKAADIEKMDAGLKPKDRLYDDFVKEVVEQAEKN